MDHKVDKVKRCAFDAAREIVYTRAEEGTYGSKKTIINTNKPSSNQNSLINIGSFYGERNIDLPEEFDNEWIKKGYTIGRRRAEINGVNSEPIIAMDELTDDDMQELAGFIKNHSSRWTLDEDALINVGMYYNKSNLVLPADFDYPLVKFGYFTIVLESKHFEGVNCRRI